MIIEGKYMIIGIDLGTTNSLVAYWDGEEAKIIPNVMGSKYTPSIVSVGEEGEIFVGEIAKERTITHPKKTVEAFKRYMGTNRKVYLGEFCFTPEELSSFILKSLKEDAEAFLQQEIIEAVISVPAYFNDMQRKATKNAAELAGLKVQRLISEPTAAAIAYGLQEGPEDIKYLIFDLGGGTFDVSILERFENLIEVKALAGDNFLGGEDFKQSLVEYFIQENQIDFYQLDSKVKSILNKQAELCKRQLSNNKTAKMSIMINNQKIETIINQRKFEEIVSSLLYKLYKPVERALNDAELTSDDIDRIILIGGATRMPVVRSLVAKMFQKLPYAHINPDEAVALGAAIQAALKERKEELEEMILTDVCAYTLGIEVAKEVEGTSYKSGYFLPIIERNTTIPVSRVKRVQTIHDQQKELSITVYQGESLMTENNIKLGELIISVPAAPANEQFVDVRYTYDINGILEVEATVLKTGKKKHLIIENNPGNMTKEEIQDCLERLKDIKIHPRDRIENKLLLARAERLFEESLGDTREYIASLVEKFEYILNTQDMMQIKKVIPLIKERLDRLEGRQEE